MVNTSSQIQNYQRLRLQNSRTYVPYRNEFRFPAHPHQKQLSENHEKAYEKYRNAFEVFEFAVRRRAEPNFIKTEETDRGLEECQDAITAAEQAAHRTSQELQAFLDHTPDERIALLNTEIEEFESQLEEAQKAEFEFTQVLLSDPDAARARLERIVQGYTGQDAEFSSQQLSGLRDLKRQVESIKSKIFSHKRDIQIIHNLVAEEERKASIKARMDEVLPAFTQACASFEKALSDLLDVANEYDIRLYTENIKIPKSANLKEPDYTYKNGNIYFEF